MGKNEKNLKNFEKKSFGVGKKNFGSDTEIGPWFQFPIPKPGFGRTLQTVHEKKSCSSMMTYFWQCTSSK